MAAAGRRPRPDEAIAALTVLEQALPVRDVRLVTLNVDHAWDRLRKEPRFVALKRELGVKRFGPGLASV